MFPAHSDVGKKEDNLSIALLGNRVHSDQTLVEYLIEFLLVFASPKNSDESGKLQFHSAEAVKNEKISYWVAPQSALRRFIFYDNSKQESRSAMDSAANRRTWELLRKTAQNGEEDIELIHDLLHSYAIVTRNRGWYAQALLPVAPELLLTDLQGIKKRQKNENWDIDSKEIDTMFDIDKHNFLARGGQVIYLHLLQGLMSYEQRHPETRAKLERLITNMLAQSGENVGILANFVQKEWESTREYTVDMKHFNMGYIQDDFAIRSERFLREVLNFLSNDIHPIARIELLSQGFALSLLRSMHIVAHKKASSDNKEPVWVVDVSNQPGTSNISRMASESYAEAYHSFLSAMTKICEERQLAAEDRFALLQKGKQNTSDVFKDLGKEIKLVTPPRGGHERFSLSEQLVRYLVLALVKPSTKITFDSFLQKLYNNFRMVIAPAQYRLAVADGVLISDESMIDYFETNAKAFQEFMKQCGFLRDLSDATAIVENPYREVKLDEATD